MCKSHLSTIQQSKLLVEKVISAGKFGVFLARSSTTTNQYVIKAFQKDEYSHCSFIKEKRVHSSLKHPNIIEYVPDYLFQVDISQFTVIYMEYAPYGDFFNLILDYNFADEKLIRTYFHQLVEGLRYIHNNGIAHLDLKLENLLLGKDLLLKIADFDLAQSINDDCLTSGGTANYRAPEVLSYTATDFVGADIYSIGVCLYTLMTGAFPFFEEEESEGIKLSRYDSFVERNEEFWAENQALVGERIHLSASFKKLVNKMWAPNPAERLSLEQIMTSEWYNEPIYNTEELQVKISNVLTL